MNKWAILKSSKKNYLAKKSFTVSWPTEKLVTKNMNMFLMFGKKIELKMMKDYHHLYLKFDVLLIADAFEKFKK